MATLVEDATKRSGKASAIGVRMDMTPMVDVAFLLLTFFMLTTVFSRPQAMEVNLPESEDEVKIAESKVMTIRGSDDGNIYWNMGDRRLPSGSPTTSSTPPSSRSGRSWATR